MYERLIYSKNVFYHYKEKLLSEGKTFFPPLIIIKAFFKTNIIWNSEFYKLYKTDNFKIF